MVERISVLLDGSSLLQLFRSKAYNRVATIPAMLISALIHEYVLWAPVRFVLPVLLLEYCTFGGKPNATLTSCVIPLV